MKVIRTYALIAILLISVLCGMISAKTENESQKNFLKVNTEKNEKTLKAKAESLVQLKTEATTSATTSTSTSTNSLPIVNNHKLEAEKSEEDKYELERANAMADLIF